MRYRTLGRTGLKVSQLGFGAMRLPMVGEDEEARVDREKAIPMIHRAFEGGVNYIDTAVGYCNRDSQRAVGEALEGWRDRIVVSTKNHDYGESEKAWWQNLEDSLEYLRTDYIDIYNHHGINREKLRDHVQPRVSKWMQKAKDQGLIRHICTSFHDEPEVLFEVIDTDYVDVITVQYNMLDQKLADAIDHAREKNVGVVVMGPVGGGRLGADSDVLGSLLPEIKRVPELALRFVLSNPSVTVALSGMSTMEHVEENLAAASDEVSLSPEDRAIIARHLERLESMAELYCTGCEYCMPCPVEVDIAGIFKNYNLAKVYGLTEAARERYENIRRRGRSAEECVHCGECLDQCPQNIDIPSQLDQADELLSA
ncbi:MAG: aldo/keto reductase [Phycisphaeraceae bacterium]